MQERSELATETLASRRDWIGLAVLALPAMLVAMDIGALFLALPHLSADLDVTSTEQLWIIDIYGFMLAGFLITMGTLGDRIGRRRLLMIGATAFTLASIVGAFADSGPTLIAARCLLGIAGATLSPPTLALISDMFHNERQRNTAISIWATALFGGTAFGPVVGGLLVEQFWWGAVFLLGVPFMIVLLATGPYLLPESKHEGAGRFDLPSSALSLAAVLPIVYGIKKMVAEQSGGLLIPVGAIAVGLGFGAVFVRRQGRLLHPLVDFKIMSARSTRAALVAMMLASGALAGVSLMSTQYVQSVEGLSPSASGLWQAPTGLGIAIGTMSAPVLMRFLSTAHAIMAGLSLSLLAMCALTVVGSSGWLIAVVVAVAVVALGTGPLFTQGTSLVIGSVPAQRAGSAASLSESSNVLGSTLGLALLGTAGAAAYRRKMSDADLSGVPVDAARSARESVASATALGDTLGSAPAARMATEAGEAFTNALNTVAGLGSLIVAGVIALVWTAIRERARPPWD